MLDFVRRHPVAAHFCLSIMLACLVVAFALLWTVFVDPSTPLALGQMSTRIYAGPGYANIVTILGEAARKPILLTVFGYALAPTLAALALAALGAGGGLRRLLSRLRPLGPEGRGLGRLWIYVAVLAVYALGIFAYDWVAGPGLDANRRFGGFGAGIFFGALIGLFVDEGGTDEELGWRGFEWPNLRDSMRSPLAAVLLLGVLHWAWHLPREAFTILGGAALGSFVAGQAVFLLLCLALAIVSAWCVNKAGGSIWPAVFVHGGSNSWSKALGQFAPPSFGFIDIRFMIIGVLAIAIVLAGRRGLARPPRLNGGGL